MQAQLRFEILPSRQAKVQSSAQKCFKSWPILVGAVGIEPTTFGLKGRCSTTELRPYFRCAIIRKTGAAM
jgi:hypothetical protein